MKHPLGMWMLDNAELFRYAGELRCMREEAERILLSGDASAFLAPLFREMYPESTIIASSPDQAVLDDAASDDPALVKDLCDIRGAVYEDISIAVSVLAIQAMETRELTGYLFNLHDSLIPGGNLYVSFPSDDRFVFSPMKQEDAWYAMDVKVRIKRYQPDDVLKALSMIGFDIRAVEKDEAPDLGTVFSIHAVRR